MPAVEHTTIDGVDCVRVPLLGAAAAQRALVFAFDWERISRYQPDWHLLGEGRYGCVVATRHGQPPLFTTEMLARVIARPDDGWAVMPINEDPLDLRRSNLVLKNVDTGRTSAASLVFERRRRPKALPNAVALAA